jgi:hypothetical protein
MCVRPPGVYILPEVASHINYYVVVVMMMMMMMMMMMQKTTMIAVARIT